MAPCYHSGFGGSARVRGCDRHFVSGDRIPHLHMADESETNTQDDDAQASEVTFVGFVLSLAHTAAVHFGDTPDPMSGRTAPPNLQAAQQIIDVLAIIEQKTRGNLPAEERQLLEQLLYELRLRYVEIGKSGAAGEPPSRIILP